MTNGSAPRVLAVLAEVDGGVAEHVRQVAGGLALSGRTVVVAGPEGLTRTSVLEAAGVALEHLPIDPSMLAARADVQSIRKVMRLAREHRIDVLHGHGQKGGIIARAAALALGLPAVYSPHGFGYRNQLLRPRRVARARRLFALSMERALGRSTAVLVACSRDERDAAVRDRVMDAARITITHHGVAPRHDATPDPRLTALRGDGPVFGFVSTLREQKGLPMLLDALDVLAARGALPRVAIVGDGPMDGYVRERLRAHAARAVLFPYEGPMERHLLALDVLVHPTYWEGMPIAVLEAMALGLPVIATAVNGVPEAIDDGRTGVLVAPGDVHGLVEAMLRLSGDSVLRRDLGAAARATARDRFSLERMLSEQAAVHDRAANAARRRRVPGPRRRTAPAEAP